MTKEELVKEAKDSWWNDNNCSGALPTEKIYECGYLAGAEPREKRIAELEDKLANADYQLEGRDNEIRELEAQIEKMKNCRNCKRFMIEGVCGHFLQVGWCKNWELVD